MFFSKEIISSRNNPTVKWAASLKEKKGRGEASAFMIEGEKLTYEAFEKKLPVTHVFVREDKAGAILERLRELDGKYASEATVILLKNEAFEKISTENAPQGVISVLKRLDFFCQKDIIYKEEFSFDKLGKTVALCSVRDPGNLGAVIRSSVAFGVEHIILSSDCADVYNPKTVRGAMGSLFRVGITIVSNLEEAIVAMRESGRRVFAAELSDGARSVKDIELLPSDVFVIGNEGHGIPENVSRASTHSVYIPISENTESLNASVAAAVFMWEQSK